MREMTNREIQLVSLDILKDVHKFCVKHSINYILYGGTMIGALRHKGFIPWDDDIDIAMPRPDYERFIREYNSEKGYRLFAYNTEDSYLPFSRVCEMEKTVVLSDVLKWSNMETGIWIDVFPLDGATDNEILAEKKVKRMHRLFRCCIYARAAHSPFSSAIGLSKKVKLFFKKVFFINPIVNIYRLKNHYCKLCRELEWGSTRHFCNFSFIGFGMREYQKMEDYQSRLLVRFEDEEFYICNGYDSHLRHKYGDYMQMPPKEERVSRHPQYYHYWKD